MLLWNSRSEPAGAPDIPHHNAAHTRHACVRDMHMQVTGIRKPPRHPATIYTSPLQPRTHSTMPLCQADCPAAVVLYPLLYRHCTAAVPNIVLLLCCCCTNHALLYYSMLLIDCCTATEPLLSVWHVHPNNTHICSALTLDCLGHRAPDIIKVCRAWLLGAAEHCVDACNDAPAAGAALAVASHTGGHAVVLDILWQQKPIHI
jgi:hypothetical protein